jgi:hypothetical protein
MPSICGFRVFEIMITHVKYQERIVNSNVSNDKKNTSNKKMRKKLLHCIHQRSTSDTGVFKLNLGVLCFFMPVHEL